MENLYFGIYLIRSLLFTPRIHIADLLYRDHKHITDDELLDRFRADGNSDWLGILLERYTVLLFGVCMKYLKQEEPARDAASASMVTDSMAPNPGTWNPAKSAAVMVTSERSMGWPSGPTIFGVWVSDQDMGLPAGS